MTREVGSTSDRNHNLRAMVKEVLMPRARRTWIDRSMKLTYRLPIRSMRLLYQVNRAPTAIAIKGDFLLHNPKPSAFSLKEKTVFADHPLTDITTEMERRVFLL